MVIYTSSGKRRMSRKELLAEVNRLESAYTNARMEAASLREKNKLQEEVAFTLEQARLAVIATWPTAEVLYGNAAEFFEKLERIAATNREDAQAVALRELFKTLRGEK
jgi:hypothetical protein